MSEAAGSSRGKTQTGELRQAKQLLPVRKDDCACAEGPNRAINQTNVVMDSLVESASTYAEVLRNCSSVKVAEWKQEDLERAVNWAEYFKRVSDAS